MGRKILIINGHPDAGQAHFGDALLEAYLSAARDAGHAVERLNVAALDFPLLRTREDWESHPPCPDIKGAQDLIAWAEHLLFLYPLWLGTMPALLKGFLEQVLRPGFAFGDDGKLWGGKLKGKSARIVVTMGMPSLVYRWYFGAHSLISLQRNILAFCGIGPIRTTLVGMVESHNPAHRDKALRMLGQLGMAGK